MAKSKRRYFDKRGLTNAMQAAKLKTAFPNSAIKLERNIGMSWLGQIQPTPLSATYTVKINYRLDERPEVTIVDPVLISRNGSRLPHVFKGNHPCLFRFKYREWNAGMLIADTILPWASMWLMHYEIWLATGVWCGSKEEHPSDDAPKDSTG
jgi:hypothetical protein